VSSLAVIWAVQDCGNKVEAVAKPAEIVPVPVPVPVPVSPQPVLHACCSLLSYDA
jgi:hypothetical protein